MIYHPNLYDHFLRLDEGIGMVVVRENFAGPSPFGDGVGFFLS
jgi:hypothetical protein